jgi:hypothetical protein
LTVQDSWGWSHMSHIRCMYLPRNIYTKVGRIVESRIVGMVSHVSFGACTSNTFTPRWARMS